MTVPVPPSPFPTDCSSYFLFHGTGTSSALPLIPCITQSENAHELKCTACRSCVDPDIGGGEGWKNIRGNIGGVLRKKDKDGIWRTIVIDVGKTFRQNAVKLFREHKIDRVDAVILTHAHADAIAGLDDLRSFTGPPSPQAGQPLPIYVSAQTMKEVVLRLPYLVDKNKATGGGDVPSLEWIVWGDETREEEFEGFEVAGFKVLPLRVQHGKYFTPPEAVDPLDSFPKSGSTTPSRTPLNNSITARKPSALRSALSTREPSPAPEEKAKLKEYPYWCNGFLFDDDFLYLSDLSIMPDQTWASLVAGVGRETVEDVPPSPYSSGIPFSPNVYANSLPPGQIKHFVLDCLRIEPHTSHLGWAQSLALALRVKAKHTWLVGFTHPDPHIYWESVAGKLQDHGKGEHPNADKFRDEESVGLAEFEQKIRKSVEKLGMEAVWKEGVEWGGHMYPGYDGQVLRLDE